MRGRGDLAGASVELRTILGGLASNPVLPVLGIGAYPTVLPEVSVVPKVRYNAPWGGREGRGSPMPGPGFGRRI